VKKSNPDDGEQLSEEALAASARTTSATATIFIRM
jgi:hypothetical protein